jgi:hypothetical protein
VPCVVQCLYIYIQDGGGGTFARFCLQTLFSRPTRRLIVRARYTHVRVLYCVCVCVYMYVDQPTYTLTNSRVCVCVCVCICTNSRIHIYVFTICYIVSHTWEFRTTAGINQFRWKEKITVRPGSGRYYYFDASAIRFTI